MRRPSSETRVQGTCLKCGKNKQRRSNRLKDGSYSYSAVCERCHRDRYSLALAVRPVPEYTRHKKDHCEDCGFVPAHPCQLDVDHVDGDHANDDPLNLRTRCANCHRLKTFLSKDWLPTI